MKIIFTCRLAELMDKREFQRENLEESMIVSDITMEITTFKSLHKPTELQLHQRITLNWVAVNEKSMAMGGVLAEDCGTGDVRLSCALEIYCLPHSQSSDSDSTRFNMSPRKCL